MMATGTLPFAFASRRCDRTAPARAVAAPGAPSSTFEGSADCALLMDLEGRLLRMNRNGQRLLGNPEPSQWQGQPWASLWAAAHRNLVTAHVALARRGGQASFSGCWPTAGGVDKWWQVTVAPARPDGAITHLIAICREVEAPTQPSRPAPSSLASIQLNLRDFRLRDVLLRTTAMAGEACRAKGLQWLIDIAADVQQSLCGDSARLCQVLLNLASRVIELGQSGAVKLEVTVDSRGDDWMQLRFSIRGTLARADAARARNAALPGLDLCRHIVELMGGAVGIEWHESGEVEFWCTPRVKLGRDDGAEVSEFAAPPATLRGRRVLVVEDERPAADLVQQLLELAEMHVDVVPNGKLALQALSEAAYDIVLMDQLMPVMNGPQATRQIRLHPAWQSLPIIGTGAHAREQDRRAFSSAGANGFIPKPHDPAKLWSALAFWIAEGHGAAPAGPAGQCGAGLGEALYQPTMPASL